MAMKNLDLSALGTFDGGRIAAALERELRYAVDDCRDRPNEDKARKVVLQIEVEPVPPDKSGDVDSISLSFQVKSAIPTRKSRIYSVGVKKNGTLFYSEDSPDNVKQTTLLDGNGDVHDPGPPDVIGKVDPDDDDGDNE